MNDPHNQQPTDFDKHSERVWQFFERRPAGVFVEVGANHPTRMSQTGFLEARGWSGVLVEPHPELCTLLREWRPRSQTFQVAVASPAMVGETDLLLGVSDLHSTLTPVRGDPLSGARLRVPVRTLDAVLAEAGVERIDFLSIDVEGAELEVLLGLTLEKYFPQLILLEDKHQDFKKYFHLRRHGYRLVKRTDLNDWYVPAHSPATIRTMTTRPERLRLWRKMWLNAPCDNAYKRSRNRVRRMFRGLKRMSVVFD
jgi:FkbM family methyltransferase